MFNDIIKNPISEASLTAADVCNGARFMTYSRAKRGGDVRRGTFKSEAYPIYEGGYDGDFGAFVQWDGKPKACIVLLSTLGIVPNRYTGEFAPDVITIPDDTDEFAPDVETHPGDAAA